jgi:hypothetical protein
MKKKIWNFKETINEFGGVKFDRYTNELGNIFDYSSGEYGEVVEGGFYYPNLSAVNGGECVTLDGPKECLLKITPIFNTI